MLPVYFYGGALRPLYSDDDGDFGGVSTYKYSTSVNAFFWSTSGKRFYVL